MKNKEIYNIISLLYVFIINEIYAVSNENKITGENSSE
jgi:hypothetical protein